MSEITHKIGIWFDQNKRDLPWRHTRDAYRIWLSEIILQQTRVVQGMDYYLNFVKAYPTVEQLAAAPLDEVLKLWQGLGYYSRARNLHAAARQVVERGVRDERGQIAFPDRYEELIGLKGVGPYTAAAIASFASDERVAVVDGNVYRVLSRLLDVDTPIDTGRGQKEFQALANELLLEAPQAGRHNQAMMEFGALHCTPTSPRCHDCPVMAHCLSRAHGTVEERPVKQGRVKVRERRLVYIIYIYRDSLWVHQRGAGDIWQGLYDYVLLPEGAEVPGEAVHLLARKHQLTHQTLYADFHVVRVESEAEAQRLDERLGAEGCQRVTWLEWQQRAVPRLIDESNRKLSDWF